MPAYHSSFGGGKQQVGNMAILQLAVMQFHQGHDACTCLQFLFVPLWLFSVRLKERRIIFPVFELLLIEVTSFKPLVSTIIGPLLPAMVSILKPHLFPHKFYPQLPLSTYD